MSTLLAAPSPAARAAAIEVETSDKALAALFSATSRASLNVSTELSSVSSGTSAAFIVASWSSFLRGDLLAERREAHVGKTQWAGSEEPLLKDLVAAEVLQSQIEFCRVDQRVHRRESHDLAPDHRDPVSLREQLDQLVCFEQLALVVVGHIHRDLDQPPLLQLET